MGKRWMAVGVAVALVAVATAGRAGAITRNYQDDHDHPFVGLMVAFDGEGERLWRCTGSLVDPVTFVTAGHCVDGIASAIVYFHQAAAPNLDPDLGYDPGTGYPEMCIGGDPLCVHASTVVEFGYDDFAGFPDTKDLGLLILDTAMALGEYGELPEVGALDGLSSKRGLADTTFLASGYGLTYSSPASIVSFRERLMAYGTLVNTVSANNGGFNVQTQGHGRDRDGRYLGGTCSGDSGGPIFYPADSNIIVALTSFGDQYCRGGDYAYRIDRQETLDFIAGHMDD